MWAIALIVLFGMTFVGSYYEQNPIGGYYNVMGHSLPFWFYLILGVVGLIQTFGTISLLASVFFFFAEMKSGRVTSIIEDEYDGSLAIDKTAKKNGSAPDVYAPVAAGMPVLTTR